MDSMDHILGYPSDYVDQMAVQAFRMLVEDGPCTQDELDFKVTGDIHKAVLQMYQRGVVVYDKETKVLSAVRERTHA